MQRLLERFHHPLPHRRRPRRQPQNFFAEDPSGHGETISCSTFSSLEEDDEEERQQLQQALALSQQAAEEAQLEGAYRMSLLDESSFVMVDRATTTPENLSLSKPQHETPPSSTGLEPAMYAMTVAAIEEEDQQLVFRPLDPISKDEEQEYSPQPEMQQQRHSQMTRIVLSEIANDDGDMDTPCYDCLVNANLLYFGEVLGNQAGCNEQNLVAPLCEACRAKQQTIPTSLPTTAAKRQEASLLRTTSVTPREKILRFHDDDARIRRDAQINRSASSSVRRSSAALPLAVKPKTSSMYRRIRNRQQKFPISNKYHRHYARETTTSVDPRAPISLYMYGDEDVLSDYDCLIRKHLQYFECFETCSDDDYEEQEEVGRVGIRCRNCSHYNSGNSSTDFPSRLVKIHGSAHALAKNHLVSGQCSFLSKQAHLEFQRLYHQQWTRSGECKSKTIRYWAQSAAASGIFEKKYSTVTAIGSRQVECCLGWNAFLDGEGDTRQRSAHKQYTKTMRK